MKKIYFIICIILAVGFLTGCQKKADLSLTTNQSTSIATPIPSTLERLNDSVSPKPGLSKTSLASETAVPETESFILDAPTVESTFAQNYAIALEDAQKALRSAVKYCGAKISFYGATLAEANQQSFIFYSDAFSTDYYWVVTLNGYQNNQKTRAFAARKDLASELKCMTQTGSAPGNFTSAYSDMIKTEKFKRIDPGTIAQTIVETMDSGWNITVIDNAGKNVIVNTINPTPNE